MIQDINALVDSIKDIYKGSKSIAGKKIINIFKSADNIEKKASKGIMQFPVLVSDAVDKEVLRVVIESLELDYASFVKVAMGLEDVIDLVNDKESKAEFIKRFHQNIDMSDSRENLPTSLKSSEDLAKYITKNAERLNEKMLKSIDEDLRSDSLNDKTIDWKILDKISEEEDRDKQIQANIDTRDVKKLNSKQPSLLELNIHYKGENTIKDTKLVLGVKAVAHALPTNEVTEKLANSVKDNSVLFKAIQWTSGEISFFKDFLLNLDNIRAEFEKDNKGRRKSRWWHILKTRASESKFREIFGKDKFVPNTTFVITKEEVKRMKNEYGVDVMDSSQVKKLLDIYHLLGFVVLDEINDLAYFWDSSVQDWQTMSFSALEKGKSSSGLKRSDLKMMLDLSN
jgi:hypothetical protein